jgi:hypothetical protein
MIFRIQFIHKQKHILSKWFKNLDKSINTQWLSKNTLSRQPIQKTF